MCPQYLRSPLGDRDHARIWGQVSPYNIHVVFWTQNMISHYAFFENWPTVDPCCAKTGPNTTASYKFYVISR